MFAIHGEIVIIPRGILKTGNCSRGQRSRVKVKADEKIVTLNGEP